MKIILILSFIFFNIQAQKDEQLGSKCFYFGKKYHPDKQGCFLRNNKCVLQNKNSLACPNFDPNIPLEELKDPISATSTPEITIPQVLTQNQSDVEPKLPIYRPTPPKDTRSKWVKCSSGEYGVGPVLNYWSCILRGEDLCLEVPKGSNNQNFEELSDTVQALEEKTETERIADELISLSGEDLKEKLREVSRTYDICKFKGQISLSVLKEAFNITGNSSKDEICSRELIGNAIFGNKDSYDKILGATGPTREYNPSFFPEKGTGSIVLLSVKAKAGSLLKKATDLLSNE